MNTPKVSVIMPVFNADKYLSQTIDSILSQTLDDFEFLIINDGSTDRSAQILNSYTDPRIKVFENEKNIGYVRTLNKLLELSKGEYIARQDNDDISYAKRLEKQVNFLNKNQEIGVCGTNILCFGVRKIKTVLPLMDDEIRAYMLIKNPIFHPTVMYRRSIFDELDINKYDESLCPAEDYAMWFEVSKKTKLANLSEPLLKYRWHGNNTSTLKKNIQIEKSNLIRKNILESTLHYEISENESLLLNLISTPETVNLYDLKSLEHLLIKLLKKNSEIGYYKEKAIRDLFFFFWTKICLRTESIVFTKKINNYFSSSLFNSNSVLNYISKRNINKLIYDQNI